MVFSFASNASTLPSSLRPRSPLHFVDSRFYHEAVDPLKALNGFEPNHLSQSLLHRRSHGLLEVLLGSSTHIGQIAPFNHRLNDWLSIGTVDRIHVVILIFVFETEIQMR